MSDESTALVAIQECGVDFHGDEILATLVEVEGIKQVYIPLRPICEYLGLSWSGQRERINRDPVLAQEAQFVRVTRPNKHGDMRGDPNVLCLPLELSRAVRDHVRRSVWRECHQGKTGAKRKDYSISA